MLSAPEGSPRDYDAGDPRRQTYHVVISSGKRAHVRSKCLCRPNMQPFCTETKRDCTPRQRADYIRPPGCLSQAQRPSALSWMGAKIKHVVR